MPVQKSEFERLVTDAQRELDANYESHGNPQFARLLRLTSFDRQYVRGHGSILVDDAGREYLDCIAGYAVHGIGRAHPDMIAMLDAAIRSGHPGWVQFERNPLAALLAHRLAERVPGDLRHAFFSNSGSEAVECALKLSRRATGRDAVLHCEQAFHGLTLGALAANGNEHLRSGFGSLGASCSIRFDDLPALEEALASRRFAAFIIEPVQGKSCRALSDGYLGEATRLCTRFGTLLVVDEVQTGIGRTGRFLGIDHDPACVPDIVVLSKALSGGFVPVAATLTRGSIWDATFDSMSRSLVHNATFQGGVLAMTAALTTLDIHDREQLSERARVKGEILRSGFEECAGRHSCIAEVRGRGLMLGIALKKSASERLIARLPLIGGYERLVFGQAFVMEMLVTHSILCQVTDSETNVMKFTPPLVIDDAQCRSIVSAVDATLEKLGRGLCASASGTMRALRQVVGRRH